jgi:hypothetical protein
MENSAPTWFPTELIMGWGNLSQIELLHSIAPMDTFAQPVLQKESNAL